MSPPARAAIELTPPGKDEPPARLDWIVRGFLARRYGTLLVGDPGDGKSTCLAWLCAQLTFGLDPFLAGQQAKQPRRILLSSPETGIAESFWPAFYKQGGDPDYMHVLDRSNKLFNPRWLLRPESESVRKTLLTEYNMPTPDVLMLDPLSSHADEKKQMNDPLQSRAELEHGIGLACSMNAGFLASHHFNKDTGGKALYRSANSIQILATVRLGFALVPIPDQQYVKVLGCIKTNLPDTLEDKEVSTFQIKDTDAIGLKLHGDSEQTAKALLEAQRQPNSHAPDPSPTDAIRKFAEAFPDQDIMFDQIITIIPSLTKVRLQKAAHKEEQAGHITRIGSDGFRFGV